MTLVRLEGITKAYGEGRSRQVVLDGVGLEIAAGEMVALRGPSGSGKSTLLHIIGVLDRPDAGRYFLDGCEVSTLDRRAQARLRNRSIGFVFQAFHLLPDATAAENIELPLLYAGVGLGERRRTARAVLERLGLVRLAERRPGEMSGGQRQRVAVARALVLSPPLVIADEPTGNLDSRAAADVLGLLKDVHARGHTVVLVTHDETVAAAAHRQVFLRDGRTREAP